MNEAGRTMTKEQALQMLRRGIDWLRTQPDDAKCTCGSCFLCAYNTIAAALSTPAKSLPDCEGWWWEWDEKNKKWFKNPRNIVATIEPARFMVQASGMVFGVNPGQWIRATPPPPAGEQGERHTVLRQTCDNCRANLPNDNDVRNRGAMYGFKNGKTLCWKCMIASTPQAVETVERNRKTSWDIACEWYGEEEIHRAIHEIRHYGPGESYPVPRDVGSVEFSKWLTLQYRLAMNKGIQLGRGDLQSAITAATAELQARCERLEGELANAIQNQNANWQLYMDMHVKWEAERTYRQHTESQITALREQLAGKGEDLEW